MITLDDVGHEEQELDMALTPTLSRRRRSTVSSKCDYVCDTSTATYDSGNCSSSSNVSDCSANVDLQPHIDSGAHYQHMLREKEYALFLALQDVRKLRSELERLNKSEQWYKQELRVQKSTRLEALERLYAQERKYMQENQRLQQECVRLYSICGELEQELEAQKAKALQKLADEKAQNSHKEVEVLSSSEFEIEQQQALILDQQQLIAVLRKQKGVLLEELKRLTCDKDAKVSELQQTLVGLELENTRITVKCKQLLIERQGLKDTLKTRARNSETENAENSKLQNIICDLRKTTTAQEHLLALKEHEIHDLQQQFKASLKDKTNVDEVHRISMNYHAEINAKTSEIASLKSSLSQLQEELISLANLQAQNEQQGQQIEMLHFTMQAQQLELQNLQEIDATKAQQIVELQRSMEQFRREQAAATAQLQSAQTARKSLEHELISLNKQYANMCALCERTRFELELREIEERKLKFQAKSDKDVTEQMREKLRAYLQKTAELSSKILELEAQLQKSIAERNVLQKQLRQVQEKLSIAEEQLKEREREEVEENEVAEEEAEELPTEPADLGSDLKLLETQASMCQPLKETEQLKTELSKESQILKISQLQQELQESTKECKRLHVKLESREENMEKLKRRLLKSDAKLYKMEKAQQRNEDMAQSTVGTLQELQHQHTELRSELKAARQSGSELQQELQKERKNVMGLKAQLAEVEEQRKAEELGAQMLAEVEQRQRSTQLENEEEVTAICKYIKGNTKLYALFMEQQADNGHGEEMGVAIERLCEKMLSKDLNFDRQEQTEIGNFEEEVCSKNEQQLCASRAGSTEMFEQTAEGIEESGSKAKLTAETLETVVIATEQPAVCTPLPLLQANVFPECSSQSNAQAEVVQLRAQLLTLQQQLQDAASGDAQKSEQRISLINRLLTQQNDKVQQLNEARAEWEELLQVLHATQQLQLNTCNELAAKRTELEELNALFAEQNEQLQELQAHTLQAQYKRSRDVEVYQEQLQQRQQQLREALEERDKQRDCIAELQARNERLQNNLDAVYACEVADNRKQVRQLQAQMDKLQRQREVEAVRVAEVQQECYELRQSKRQAIVVSDLVLRRGGSVEMDEEVNGEIWAVMEEIVEGVGEAQKETVEDMGEAQEEENLKQEEKLVEMKIVKETQDEEGGEYQFRKNEKHQLRMREEYRLRPNVMERKMAEEVEQEEIKVEEKKKEKKSEKEQRKEEKHKKKAKKKNGEEKNEDKKKAKEEKQVEKTTEEANKVNKTVKEEKNKIGMENCNEDQVGKVDGQAEIDEQQEERHLGKREEQMEKKKKEPMPCHWKRPETKEGKVSSERCIEGTQATKSSDTDDRLRILTKVLEAEHQRKMKRYDLHIHTLLRNVRGLRGALKTAENKTAILQQEQTERVAEVEDLQLTKQQLEELRLKFEQSQSTVQTLEQALEQERKKFETSDLGKCATTTVESTHEVANLIDDYKKLIQQSAVATCRPKISAILELIQRSSQCVPNLNKLESTVSDLRADVQQFVAHYAQERVTHAFSTNALNAPSLLEELRTAAQQF